VMAHLWAWGRNASWYFWSGNAASPIEEFHLETQKWSDISSWWCSALGTWGTQPAPPGTSCVPGMRGPLYQRQWWVNASLNGQLINSVVVELKGWTTITPKPSSRHDQRLFPSTQPNYLTSA
jgi:hypothetical protein